MTTRFKNKYTLLAVCAAVAVAMLLINLYRQRAGSAPDKQEQGQAQTACRYEPVASHEVTGRQGICCENGSYWVSGSTTLARYDKDWQLVKLNEEPFRDLETEANHIADIDVWQNEIYVGAEYFMDGEGRDIQIAVYDGDTLELKRTYPFEPESGQVECSGIAVDPDAHAIWMCSWVGGDSGKYLYRYNLLTGAYQGKVEMDRPPSWLQGIACHDGAIYMTADDGDADKDEPDHVYRTSVGEGALTCRVTEERALDDVTRTGEVEGLNFDEDNRQLLVQIGRAHV